MTSQNRTPAAARRAVAVEVAVQALLAAQLEATTSGSDMVSFSLDGTNHQLRVESVAYCTGQRARDLLAGDPDRKLVVSERITADGRSELSGAGWSWLDRRGRLHVRAAGVLVDVEVPPDPQMVTASTVQRPISGRSGLTVAYWLCQHPGESLSPTKSASGLALAPSTISTTVRRLTEAGLVDDDGVGVFPELFWELAAAWRPERVWLLDAPNHDRHRSPDGDAPGWRRTGTPAAVAYGAPIVATAGEPVELYVVGPVEISIALREYGAARPGHGAAAVMVPPVPAVSAESPASRRLDGWVAAPVLAVALDLARDRSRGREILEGWQVPGASWR